MQTVIDYIATTAAWAVTLFRLTAVVKDRRTQSPRLLQAWLFTLFLSLFLTFQVDVVYTTFDRFTGVNNLSWLLSYLFAILAVYFVCAGFRREQPYWMKSYSVVVAGLLTVIFPLGPGSTPETIDHIVPANVPELLFVGLFYVYAATMFAIVPIPVCVRAILKESELPVRLRTLVILLTLVLTIAFYLTKLSIFSLGLLVPSLSPLSLRRVTDVARLLGAVMAVLWPLSFLSNRFYWALDRPIGLLRKIVTLRDLGVLESRINRLCAPVSLDRATWLDRLRDPDFCIYRSVISILDGRKLLADRLERWGENVSGGWRAWDQQHRQEAVRLHHVLTSVPTEQGFERLVDGYRRASRQMAR